MARQKEGPVSVYVYEIEAEIDEESSSTGNHCAWCGDPPGEYGSHGICAFHKGQMEGQSAWRKLQRTPSYAERFRKSRR